MVKIAHRLLPSCRALVSALGLLLVCALPAAAQSCPSPYTSATSATGPICGTTCAPGTHPSMQTGSLTCEAGFAAPTSRLA